MAAEAALSKLQESAGLDKAEEVLDLVFKLLRNIIENPNDPKFRRVNAKNAKLASALFCYAGAADFFLGVGFSPTQDGCYELPQNATKAAIDANMLVTRCQRGLKEKRYASEISAGAEKVARNYRNAIEGGAKGAGLSEMQEILAMDDSSQALQLFEKILSNVRRYPDEKKYRSVNLSKVGQKLGPALPLLFLVGFKKREESNGEVWAEAAHLHPDVVERIAAMVYWATRTVNVPELLPTTSQASHMLGAVLGAIIGDALGAPLAGKLEYSVTAEEVDKVMEMCGGGIYGMAPGQATDCTELLMCLASSLALASEFDTVQWEDIALKYSRWGQTVPFSAEQACKQVFHGSLTKESLMEAAKNKNKNAVGAGALARCSVLAARAAGRGLNQATSASVARTDTQLSHPNFKICDASATYTILAQLLIETCGDHKGALKELRVWMERELKSREEGTGTLVAAGGKGVGKSGKGKEEEFIAPGTSIVAFKEVMSWLSKAFSDKDLPFSEERLDSSAQVAFTHAFRHVRLESTFELAMRSTLAGGGDVPRNAAIVGGLVGAAVGLDGIPARWVKAILACNTVQGQQRPPEFHPALMPELLRQTCRSSW